MSCRNLWCSTEKLIDCSKKMITCVGFGSLICHAALFSFDAASAHTSKDRCTSAPWHVEGQKALALFILVVSAMACVPGYVAYLLKICYSLRWCSA